MPERFEADAIKPLQPVCSAQPHIALPVLHSGIDLEGNYTRFGRVVYKIIILLRMQEQNEKLCKKKNCQAAQTEQV